MRARFMWWLRLTGAFGVFFIGSRMVYGSWGTALGATALAFVVLWFVYRIPPEDRRTPY